MKRNYEDVRRGISLDVHNMYKRDIKKYHVKVNLDEHKLKSRIEEVL